jgi:hypothetical protein
VALDPAAAQARHQLDQGQIPDQAPFVAAEPFQTDDACGPRTETALLFDEVGRFRGRQTVKTFEIDRAANAHESGGAAGVQPQLAQAGGGVARE